MFSQSNTAAEVNLLLSAAAAIETKSADAAEIKKSTPEPQADIRIHYFITLITDYFPKAVKIDVSKLEFNAALRAGSSSAVFRGTYKDKVVAIKIYHPKVQKSEVDDEKDMLAEVQRLKIPHVVDYVGYVEDVTSVPVRYSLVMEYLPRGDLLDFIMWTYEHNQPLTLKSRYKIIEMIANGVSALHQHHIIHRDLKLENIFVGANGEIKIGDFGFALRINAQGYYVGTDVKCTPTYAAPEIFTQQLYSPQSDVYALGCIIYTLETNLTPFAAMKLKSEQIAQIVASGCRASMPATTHPKVAKLIKWCWNQRPGNRPSASQVAQQAKMLYEEAPPIINTHRPM